MKVASQPSGKPLHPQKPLQLSLHQSKHSTGSRTKLDGTSSFTAALQSSGPTTLTPPAKAIPMAQSSTHASSNASGNTPWIPGKTAINDYTKPAPIPNDMPYPTKSTILSIWLAYQDPNLQTMLQHNTHEEVMNQPFHQAQHWVKTCNLHIQSHFAAVQQCACLQTHDIQTFFLHLNIFWKNNFKPP